jgi:hypothetical protein
MVPALSQPFLLYVADDIDEVNGTWTSRVSAGVAPMTLVKFGNPVVKTDTWTNGHKLLSGEGSGCYYIDRPYGFPATYGFSLSAVMGGAVTGTPSFYNGPKLIDVLSEKGLSMCSIYSRAGVGNRGTGRYSDWPSASVDGDVRQWDRPAGVNVPLSSWLAFKNNIALTMTQFGSYATDPSGTRFVIGGYVNPTSVENITPNTNSRVAAVILTVGGLPMTEADRAIWTTFAAGLLA